MAGATTSSCSPRARTPVTTVAIFARNSLDVIVISSSAVAMRFGNSFTVCSISVSLARRNVSSCASLSRLICPAVAPLVSTGRPSPIDPDHSRQPDDPIQRKRPCTRPPPTDDRSDAEQAPTPKQATAKDRPEPRQSLFLFSHTTQA